MTGKLTVTAPYDGEFLAELPYTHADAIDAVLDTAATCHLAREAWLPLHERIRILDNLAALMTEQCDTLALQAAREGGKPLMDSEVEAKRAIDGVRLATETVRGEAGDVIPVTGTHAGASRLAFTQKEPIGVVVAVSAFNHPLNLIVHQIVPAIAAGCPVIVKPAEDTPLSCKALVELLHAAGLPRAWCQLALPADRDQAERMVADPRVAFFSFIGSARVGWMLRAKLAPGTRCALEHGGAAPLILAADADLESALAAVLKGGFYHAGQVCVSVQRVFAERSIAEAFAVELGKRAAALVVGDPTRRETQVGPLIRPAEVERVGAWVDEASTRGASVITGGKALGHNCYAPTVLFNPPADARVSQQEIFGPVVCVYAYDDLDAALAQANALPYAFQAAVFTRDLDTAMRVYRNIDAAAVMVNDHTAFRVDGMPFAGLRQSGLGVGGIPYTIREMQIEKMMVVHSPAL